MAPYLFLILFFLVLFLSTVAGYFALAVMFGRNDYRFFKKYRASIGKKASWLIFLNHWLKDGDFKYSKAREELYGESRAITQIKRFLFTILAGTIGFISISIFVYFSI